MAEWSKALVLGTSLNRREFESRRSQIFKFLVKIRVLFDSDLYTIPDLKIIHVLYRLKKFESGEIRTRAC